MRKVGVAAVLLVLAALLAGCEEEQYDYISSAPDGTIVVCYEETLFRIDKDLMTAALLSDGVHNVYMVEYSPDGERLLCVLGTEEKAEVAICDHDGGVLSVLEEFEAEEEAYPFILCTLRWSPNGKYVSYLRGTKSDEADREIDISLQIREVDGDYHFDMRGDISPRYAWSRDSTEIAVISGGEGDPNMTSLGTIKIWNVAEKSLVDEPAGVLFPSGEPHELWLDWTQDGKKLLFTSRAIRLPASDRRPSAAPRLELSTVGRWGKDYHTVLKEGTFFPGTPEMLSLSPNGTEIAYVLRVNSSSGPWAPGGNRPPECHLYVAGSDGQARTKVLECSDVRGAPTWLANNRLACLVQEEGRDYESLFVIERREGGARKTDIMSLIRPFIEAREQEEAAPESPDVKMLEEPSEQ